MLAFGPPHPFPMRLALLPLVLILAFSAPAEAQQAACTPAAPALPTVGHGLGARFGRAHVAAPRAARPARPGASCAARETGLPTEVLQDTWDGSDWALVTRTRYAANAAGQLALVATDVRLGSGWAPDAEDTFAYDGAGRLTVHARRYWVGTDEIRDYRETFTYSAAGRVAEYVYELGTPTGWENAGRALPTYDAAGRPATVRTQGWTGTAWADAGLDTYAYTATGRLAEQVSALWDGAAFQPSARETRAYDAATDSLALWTFFAPDGGGWAETGREVYTLDATGRPTGHVGLAVVDGALVNILRDRFTYRAATGTDLTFAESRTWDGSDWAAGFREALAYDGAGRLTGYTYRSTETPGETFADLFRDLYTLDAAGRRTGVLSQQGTPGGWADAARAAYAFDALGRPSVDIDESFDGTAWTYTRRLRYAYGGGVAGEPGSGPAGLSLAAGPNPSRGAVRVTVALDAPGEVALEVFDARGRRVARLLGGAQPAGAQTVMWDAGAVAAGVYTLRLAAGQVVTSRTVTVVR